MTKIPGPQIAYTDLVDYLTSEQDDQYDAFPLRPSSAGKCSRALTYELLEWLGKGTFPKEKKAPNVKRLLSLGNSIEYHVIKNFDLLQKASPDYKIRYKQQVLNLFDIPGGPKIEGSTDLWLMNRENNRGGILDVKSTKDRFDQGFKSEWDARIDKLNNMSSVVRIGDTGWYAEDLEAFLEEFNDPFKSDNFTQLNSYCCAPFSKEHGVDHGSIIYYCKNDSRFMEIRFKPHEGMFEKLKTKFTAVWEAGKTATAESLAETLCEFPVGNIKNAFCNCVTYSGRSQADAMKAWFATFPPRKWPTDAEKIPSEKNLDGLLLDYEYHLDMAETLEKLEIEIAKELSDKKISKVRISNGNVYEVKSYRTGGPSNGPRLALRRSKP